MRKIAALLASAALTTGALAATAAPASASTATATRVTSNRTAAAAPATYRISNVQCFSNAVRFTARQQENGFSGVTQFQQRAYEQEFTSRGWVTITRIYTVNSNRFPNDGRSFFFTRVWTFTHPSNGASYRVIWAGYWFSGSRVAYHGAATINCL